MRGRGGKGAVERPHGGTRRAHDNNFTWHWGCLLTFDRGMRATSFSVILALAGTACEPRFRLWYHNGCNFSRAELQRFLAAALCLYPYTHDMQTAARAREGQTRFVPVKTLGAIKTNLLRFYNDFHGLPCSRDRSWPRKINPSRSKNTRTGGSTIPARAPISRSRISPPWSRKAMISWSLTPRAAMTLPARC